MLYSVFVWSAIHTMYSVTCTYMYIYMYICAQRTFCIFASFNFIIAILIFSFFIFCICSSYRITRVVTKYIPDTTIVNHAQLIAIKINNATNINCLTAVSPSSISSCFAKSSSCFLSSTCIYKMHHCLKSHVTCHMILT